jgi:RNA polymerase sigma-B factor
MLEQIGREDAGYDDVELDSSLSATLRRLPREERQALTLRLRDDLKQSEVAEILGCSQMHVSRLLRRAGDRLRAELDPDLAQLTAVRARL